jgi:GNAT superfamily N-acetyltransferase
MASDNLNRMMHLVEESFAMKNDPDQLAINTRTMKKLLKLHPRTLNEKKNRMGPVAWVLIIPTTNAIMKDFLTARITEKDLLRLTPDNVKYDALYLCSALVLPEYRRKGLASTLLIQAIRSIQKKHSIRELFCWVFSPEGKKLAASIAKETNLPLYSRKRL